jgi:hypothetical protein
MSADNWTICPKCCAADPAKELLGDPEPTMREDWDIGMGRDGRFEVVYGCACEVCGWRWTYQIVVDALKGKS